MLGSEIGKTIHLDWQFPDKEQYQLKTQTVVTSPVTRTATVM